MPATIVVGGQYGSEGKGKVVALTASLLDEPWVVRCGGPNSGHTTSIHGVDRVLRQLPAAASHPGAMLLLSAGCAIDEQVLCDELDLCGVAADRVIVDPRAVLVEEEDKEAERQIAKSIASTASGTGHALMRRMARDGSVRLAEASPRLRGRVRFETVAPLLHEQLDRGTNVIVEGTQGFGLSLLHGPDYPFVTSRDTTASGFAAEVGLSPRHINAITLVIRTFPIRVGGKSGPLKEEITWSDVRTIGESDNESIEYTSVTKRVRRVARFDIHPVMAACRYNRPTHLAIMGLDRLNSADLRVRSYMELSCTGRSFVADLVEQTRVPVRWLGTGFGTFDAISCPITKQIDHSHV